MPNNSFDQLNQYKEGLQHVYSHESITKIAGTPAYQKMSNDLTELYASLVTTSKEVDGVVPPLGKEDYDQIRQQYANLSTSLNEFATFAIENNTPEMAVTVAGLNRLITQDSKAMDEIAPNGKDNIFNLMTKCRNAQVEVPAGSALGAEKGAISSRIPMAFTDASGKDRKGFFTKDIIIDGSYSSTVDVTMSGYGASRGSSAVERNVAMSRIASLAGVPNLLAQSIKMTTEIEGNTVDGIFMDTAEGTDLTRIPKEELSKLADVTYTNEALRQIADIQVLDAICSNCDRHEGNMLYQMEEKDGKTVVSGIVGIDNDYSFTAANKYGGERIDDSNYGVNRIAHCSTSMAEKLNLMGREAFELSLQDINLSQAEKSMAWGRLERVRERINSNEITVLPDAEFAAPQHQSQLFEQNPAFRVVADGMKKFNTLGKIPEYETTNASVINYQETKLVTNGALAKREVMSKTAENLISMKEKLNDTKGFFRRDSKQFKSMMTAMDQVTPPNAISQEGLEKLSTAVNAYTDYKKDDLGNRTSRKRFGLTSELGEGLSNTLKQLNTERAVRPKQENSPQRAKVGLDKLMESSGTKPKEPRQRQQSNVKTNENKKQAEGPARKH